MYVKVYAIPWNRSRDLATPKIIGNAVQQCHLLNNLRGTNLFHYFQLISAWVTFDSQVLLSTYWHTDRQTFSKILKSWRSKACKKPKTESLDFLQNNTFLLLLRKKVKTVLKRLLASYVCINYVNFISYWIIMHVFME